MADGCFSGKVKVGIGDLGSQLEVMRNLASFADNKSASLNDFPAGRKSTFSLKDRGTGQQPRGVKPYTVRSVISKTQTKILEIETIIFLRGTLY